MNQPFGNICRLARHLCYFASLSHLPGCICCPENLLSHQRRTQGVCGRLSCCSNSVNFRERKKAKKVKQTKEKGQRILDCVKVWYIFCFCTVKIVYLSDANIKTTRLAIMKSDSDLLQNRMQCLIQVSSIFIKE